MKRNKILSNPITLLALVHHWMTYASTFTLLVVQVSLRAFRRHSALLHSGHLFVRPLVDFPVQLMRYFRSCDFRVSRAAPSTDICNSTSSLLSFVGLCNSVTDSVIWCSNVGLVSPDCKNNRISAYAIYPAKCHRAHQANKLHRDVGYTFLAPDLGSRHASCQIFGEARSCCTSCPARNIFQYLIYHSLVLCRRTFTIQSWRFSSRGWG